jgi:hypothetical protein
MCSGLYRDWGKLLARLEAVGTKAARRRRGDK